MGRVVAHGAQGLKTRHHQLRPDHQNIFITRLANLFSLNVMAQLDQ